MKLYEIVLKPQSFFGTPIKGDTLFGHFMWQIVYNNSLIKIPFKEAIKSYSKEPFIIFSSAYPKLYSNGEDKYFIAKPQLPPWFWDPKDENIELEQKLRNRKQKKKKIYLEIKRDLKVICNEKKLRSEKDIFNLYKQEFDNMEYVEGIERIWIEFTQTRNKINRLISATTKKFPPYTVDNVAYLPFLELSVFVLFNEEIIEIDSILQAMENIGLMGFGRDASSGMGRFGLGDVEELDLPDLKECHALYSLSPCIPDQKYQKAYFQPFVRFGRHGSFFAVSSNPFKNPILLMDEGAVLMFDKKISKPYIGKALFNLSKVEQNTMSQGYSIVFPIYFN